MAQPEHPRFTASDPGLDLLQRRAVYSRRFSPLSKESTLTSAAAGPRGYPLGLFSYSGWVGFSLH
jgi:hypothetical protein